MKRFLPSLALAAVLGVALTPCVQAQGKKPDPKKQDSHAQKPDDAKKTEAPPEQKVDPKIEEYERAIKDATKLTGAFTLYTRKKEIMLELPEDKLGKLFLVQASFNTGANAEGVQAGDPIGLFGVDAFKWEEHDGELWLVRPNERFRWDPNDPLAVAAQRSFPEAVLSSFRIEATEPQKKLILVNITPLFMGDVFKLNEIVAGGLGGPYMLDREKSGPEKVKSFPEDATVQMQLYFMSARGGEGGGNPLAELFGLQIPDQLEDPRSAPIRVTYNMWYRQEDGYVPRLADPRIGYFTQDFYNVDKFLAEDRTERYIMRRNIQKKDPSAAMSDAVKPVVWTVDPSVPPEYRDAVKEGLLRWNKAFEAIGIKNAIQVQDAPKDPDYDHADGRYNVVRWTMSEDSPYAVSWLRTDPFTGEILNASITFDANMLAYVLNERENMATPVATMISRKPMDIVLRDPNRKISDDDYLWATDAEILKKTAEKQMAKAGFGALECELGNGLAANAAFNWDVLRATAPLGGLKITKEQYAKAFISDTICHEAGHCLGLRHNFIASTNLSTDQLADDSITSKQGISASVMDYVPVNVMAILKGNGNFYSSTIGAYDLWAIKYGYLPTGAKSPQAETGELDKVADMSGEHGLAFETDEEADTWDPYVATFDEGSDPLNFEAKMIEAALKVRDYAIEDLPHNGQSYSKRTNMILTSIAQEFAQGRDASRFVGGVDADRNFKGDADEHPTLAPVDAKDQRTAIHLIVKNLLSADSFALPESVVMNLSLDPSESISPNWTAPLRLMISNQQMRLVAKLMSASTTDQVCENQYKWGKAKDAYTIDEHFGLILGAIFSEIGQNKSIDPTRRDLQRFMIDVLTIQAGAPTNTVNGDVRELASDALKRLSSRFGGQLTHSNGLDEMTKVHLRDTKDEIDKFLARQDVAGGH